MPKDKFLSKIANTPISRLTTPKGGIFSGRHIPKDRLNDLYWLRVLELGKPPDDGLFITRKQLELQSGSAKEDKSSRKSLPVRALYGLVRAAVEYEKGGSKGEQGKQSNHSATKKQKTRSPPISHPLNLTDWKDISPDLETERLGLEQLGRGESLTIIGAGITGLTLAWILNRSRPDIRISIYDKKPEVGGWMSSQKVQLPDGYGQVLFESGPRTLLPSHPGSEILARILQEIGVRDTIMGGLPRSSPTNQKALVYNRKIQKLPSSSFETLKFLLSAPILKGAKWPAIKDLWTKARPQNLHDESVRSFISRRLGEPLTDRMISAVMRGIYAADIDKLSARSVARLSRMYYLERTEQMSIIGAALSGSLGYLEQYTKLGLPVIFDSLVPPTGTEIRDLVNKDHPKPKFSLYGFKTGIQGLAKALADDLKTRKNVSIHLGLGVKQVEPYKASKVRVTLDDGATFNSNVVVSTVAQPSIFEKAAPTIADEMRKIKYSSLAVVNVWVPDSQYAKDWFGVLVPKTEDEWNTDNILGIIFDSSVRNAMTPDPSQREKGSNMTVMLGGDMWTDMTEEEAKEKALSGLQKVLGPLDPSKAVVNVALQRNAIPLYEVGHSARQHQIHSDLSQLYSGRVALIGMALGRGVGVSDCVIDALTVALRFNDQRKLLYPDFFFNHWLSMTRPEIYA